MTEDGGRSYVKNETLLLEIQKVNGRLDMLDHVAQDVERHERILKGNGVPGLESKVDYIVDYINEQKEKDKKQAEKLANEATDLKDQQYVKHSGIRDKISGPILMFVIFAILEVIAEVLRNVLEIH